MNRGHVLQSSPVQQMMAGGPNSWWNISNMQPPPPPQTSPLIATAPSYLFPQFPPQPNSSSWHGNQDQLPESWNQLLLGGYLVGEEDKSTSSLSNMKAAAKKLEQWEEQLLSQSSNSNGNSMVNIVKQENSASSCYGGTAAAPAYSCHGNTAEFLQATKPTWSPVVVNNNNIVAGSAAAASSPRSCVTGLSRNMLDFSNNNKADGRHPPPERSSECNSTGATGGAAKKARVQPSAIQSTFKVRKEKLGDRITSLHQLVSPFGKTDTASVLLEAIGYIRFLQSQIEALSLPYFGNGSANMRHQQSGQGERNCLFPEDPGQLLNDNCMKRKEASELQNQDSTELEPKKDLRSRGLCLVPLSCTVQVGSDNGADYWAPALNGGFR